MPDHPPPTGAVKLGTASFLAAAILLTAQPQWGAAQRPTRAVGAERVRTEVRRYRERNEVAIVRELVSLLAIPNVASDSTGIRRNAALLVDMLSRRGFQARALETQGSPPAVYGELKVPGARRTVVFYAHYDGQPVTRSQWASDPWTPVLRDRALSESGREIPIPLAPARLDPESRLYARSASDDKSPIVAFLTALDALRAANIGRSVNLKVFLEGEEEAGSSHLREMLQRHASLLDADLWIFGDGPVHQSRRMQVVFGVRGVMGLELTVYGPSRPLHSGHYGNWAPNPAARLAALLASMRDTEGRITIDGFLSDVRPLTTAERSAIASVPDIDATLAASLALGGTEGAGAKLIETIASPALNIRGLSAGAVGAEAANAIPTEARASIDFRLVADQRPDSVRARVERHIRSQGYHISHAPPSDSLRRMHERVAYLEWEGGYPAMRTPMDGSAARAVLEVVDAAAGEPVVRVPTLGGSLPMYLFQQILGAPLIVVPIVNHDNNQHAANENLRLQNLWDGIEVYAALVARLGYIWQGGTERPRP